MKLPNADRAVVDLVKIEQYCLNPQHPRGRHKARVFAAALGIIIANSQVLRDALLRAVREEDATPTEHDQYGQRYIIEFTLTHNGLSARIRSAWIVRSNEQFPRFVSCYVM